MRGINLKRALTRKPPKATAATGTPRRTSRKRKHPPAPFLPLEILLQIFDHLAPQNTAPHSIVHTCHGHLPVATARARDYSCPPCQTGLLLNVSLVCRHWHAAVSPLLYRVVRIPYSMFVPGDEETYFHCTTKYRHTDRDRFFFNVYDRARPHWCRIQECNSVLVRMHQEDKIAKLSARLETLRLLRRTLDASPHVAGMVKCLELGALFPPRASLLPRVKVRDCLEEESYELELNELMLNIAKAVGEVVRMLPALRFIDFHLDPQVVGQSPEGLRYIVKKTIAKMVWRPRLDGCKCNHVRIALPADHDGGGGARYVDSPPGSYAASGDAPTVHLYSDFNLIKYSPAIFRALPLESCEVEINLPTPPKHNRLLPAVGELQDVPMATSMRYIGPGTPGMSTIIKRSVGASVGRRSRVHVAPTTIALGEKEVQFSDLKELLAAAKGLGHLRLENCTVYAPRGPQRGGGELRSASVKSVYWDVLGGSGSATATELLVQSTRGEGMPALESLTAPVGRPYCEWWVDGLRRVHPGREIVARTVDGNDMEVVIRPAG